MIPAGLENNAIEIYCVEDKVKALHNGSTCEYLELPEQLREPFQAELLSDKEALDCLINEMKIVEPDKMEEKFVSCRFGNLDSTPDLQGKEVKADAPTCNLFTTCPGFNKVCKVPPGPNGTLSRKEFQVVCLVHKGKQDKEIAHEMSIELTTVRTYLCKIREKLCVNNRIEIAFWAQKKGIV